jgi:hypothetical protein
MVVALCERSLDDAWKQLLKKTGFTVRWIKQTKTLPGDITFPGSPISVILLASTTRDALAKEVRDRASQIKLDKRIVFVLARSPEQSLLQRCVYDVNQDATALAVGEDAVAVLQALSETPVPKQSKQEDATHALRSCLGPECLANADSLADLAARYEANALPAHVSKHLSRYF